MKKRLLSILLCFVMVLGLLPVTAYADIPENMNTWGGKQITHVEFTAYYKDDLTANSYDKARNTLQTGGSVNPDQIQFVPTSLTWKQGANGSATNKITAEESGGNGWRDVMTGGNVELKDTNGNTFPLCAEGTMYRRNGNWSSGAERWDRVYATDMPNYVKGDYRYRLYFEVLDQYLKDKRDANASVTDQFRIANSVTVTVKWLNSSMKENFTVHPGGGMGICNYIDKTMFVSTAGFLSSTISVTGNGPLKMGSGNAITSVNAGEEIKPFSVVNLVSGGTMPYTFSKVSGPAGIEVTEQGMVKGRPTTQYDDDQPLKIKVTDAAGAIATTTITVKPVKAARTVIETVELAGLYTPNANDDIATNRAYIVSVKDAAGNDITETSPLHISQIMSDWDEKNGDKWEQMYNGDLFQAGKQYRYAIQLRIDDDDACTQYRMDENMTVTAQGFGDFTLGDYSDETNYTDPYQSRYVYSPVVTADSAQHLTGKITYTGAAQFHLPLNAHVEEATAGVPTNSIKWQWQYSYTGGSTWQNISVTGSSAVAPTTNTITLGVADEYLMGRLIRAVAYSTDPDFSGAIYGAPLTVEKGWNMGIPTKPELTYDATSGRLAVTDESWKGEDRSPDKPQEYIWTTSPSVDSTAKSAVWPTDNSITSVGTGQSITVTPGTTYYVYTRYEETRTMGAGRILSAAVYTVPDPNASTAPTTVTDVYYPQYPLGQRTIYIPVGSTETFSVDYTITPDTALSGWPVWKENHTMTSAEDVDRLESITAADGKLTFKLKSGAATGETTITAYKPNSEDKWGITGTGGQVDIGRELTVVIYDANAPRDVNLLKRTLGTITLYKGDTYDLNFNYLKNNMKFVPEGVVGVTESDFTLSAELFTGTTGGFNPSDYITLNGSVITADNVTSELLPAVNIYATKGDGEHSQKSTIGYLSVKVIERPALTDFTINPSAVTLPVGDTYKLTAIKTPDNAGDTITWSSNNESAVTVDNTGKITAVTAGTASVYATCNDVTVYSVVTVKNVCTDGHSFHYVSVGGYGHKGVCNDCGYTESGAQPHDLRFYEDTGNKMHSECPTCGYHSDSMDVPASPANNQPHRPSSRPSSGSSTTTEKVNSAQTGDVGIALYAVLALTSYTGSALVIRGRKRK